LIVIPFIIIKVRTTRRRFFAILTNKNVGAIRFFNDHGAIPKPSVASSGGGFVYLNFPIQRFGDIVDILRHDKPLSIQVEDQNWGILRLFDDPLS
jgi:hypothetical protein